MTYTEKESHQFVIKTSLVFDIILSTTKMVNKQQIKQ